MFKYFKILAIKICLLSLFIVTNAASVYSADETLSVINNTRITPISYEMRNSWKGTGRPINADNTKILLNEYLAYNTGRGVVVANITDLKNAVDSDPNVWLSNYLTVTNPLNNSFINYQCTFMYAGRDVGCINRWGSQTVQWSRISGEENIVYALYDGKREVVKINVETGATSVVGTYPSGMTYPQLMGWYEPNSIIINANGNGYSSGYTMNVTNGSTTYYSSPAKFDGSRSSVEAKKWDYHSIHSARSPNKNFIIHYSGTAAKDGVFNNDCTYTAIPCDNASDYPHGADWLHGFGHNATHVNWAYSNDWYIAGTAGNPYAPYGGSPYITTHEIYQVFFSLDKETGQTIFNENLLISQQSAGLWYNGSNDLNYWALPSPAMSLDGTMIVYQSTDGKYSFDDYQTRGSTPWGTIGMFLVDLSTTPPETCTSFTYTEWGECPISGTQTRTLTSSSPSGCAGGNPVLTQSCTPQICTSFTYSSWDECSISGTQTRTVASSYPSGCIDGNPVLTQSCTFDSSSLYNILKRTISPTINGNLGEYASANSVSFAPSSGGNTVTVKAIWDDEALYLGIEVTDTQLNASVTTRDGAVWNEDSIEWFIDTYNDGGGSADPDSSYMRSDDYQGIINILNAKYDGQGTNSGTPTGSWNGAWESAVILNGTRNNNTDNDTGYTMEVKIPWTSIGYSSAPSDSTLIGLSFAVIDSDSSSKWSKMWLSDAASNQNASNWQQVFLSGSTVVADFIAPLPPTW